MITIYECVESLFKDFLEIQIWHGKMKTAISLFSLYCLKFSFSLQYILKSPSTLFFSSFPVAFPLLSLKEVIVSKGTVKALLMSNRKANSLVHHYPSPEEPKLQKQSPLTDEERGRTLDWYHFPPLFPLKNMFFWITFPNTTCNKNNIQQLSDKRKQKLQ